MKTVKNLMLGLGLAALGIVPSQAQRPVQRLPISAFLNGQVGVVHLITGLGEVPVRSLFFDAFGTQARRLNLDVGTTFDGNVKVRELANGRVHVSVLLETHSAICWADEVVDNAWRSAFGYNPDELAGSGLAPSLGDGLLRIEFTMPALTLPLPRLRDLYANDGYPAKSVYFLVTCQGTLRGGSGYPEGTAGRALMNQIRLVETGANGNCAGQDCWPVEMIRFWPTAPH